MGTEDMVKKKPQKTVSCPKPIINHKQKIKVSAANKIANAKSITFTENKETVFSKNWYRAFFILYQILFLQL